MGQKVYKIPPISSKDAIFGQVLTQKTYIHVFI